MATNVTLNNTSYSLPETGDSAWGSDVTSYLTAIASSCLQKSGGTFTLTADVDFGATYGLKSAYYKSRNTPSSTGLFRAGNDESLAWRNAGNDGDLALKVNTSDVLEFDGNPIVTLALGAANTVMKMNSGGTAYEWGTLTNDNINASAAIAYTKLNLTGTILNADINASAAIALSKLAATTASRALVSDGSGFVSAATTTATEIGYVNGVTSSIQTQLDSKAPTSSPTLTSPTLNTGVSGTAIKDEDDMTSDSDTHLATQQSIKAYVDNEIAAISATGANAEAKSADYPITDVDNIRVALVTTSTSTINIDLPTAADNQHRRITIKKVDSGSGKVTVRGEDYATTGNEKIDGSTTFDLNEQYDSITLVCDATEWHSIDYRLATATQSGAVSAYEEYTETGSLTGVTAGTYGMKAVRVGDLVTVTVKIDITDATSSTPLISIASSMPTSMEPAYGVFAWGQFSTASNYITAIRVDTNGDLDLYKRTFTTTIADSDFTAADDHTFTISYTLGVSL